MARLIEAPPAASAADRQSRFDAFRSEFNHERPHEAPGQRQPAEFYRPSPRPFIEPAGDLDYRSDEQVRRYAGLPDGRAQAG